MFYILDSLGYIEATSSHYIECDNKTCTEYKGTIPSGYSDLDDWVLNANIRAYKINTSGNLIYDEARDESLQKEYANCLIGGNRNLFNNNASVEGAIDSAGNINSSTLSKVTSYIPVKAGQQYKFSYNYETLANEAFRSYCFYDSNKTFYNFIAYDPLNKIITINPTKDGYVRIGYDKNCYNLQLEEGSIATDYINYQTIDGSRVTPNENYSTAEQIIGTWIDGKTLYRKVVSCGNLTNAGEKITEHNITNIKNIVGIKGIAYAPSGTSITIPFVDVSLTNMMGIYANKTSIVIWNGNDRSNWTAYITLEYTKTTD